MPAKLVEWNAAAASDALELARHRSLSAMEYVFGDAMAVVSGCLRGLFVASPGHDLICSDYSAIEAVGLAELAGCEWRREVFRTHGKIYEASAAQAFGIPLEEILAHKKATGEHHSIRKKGKVLELACLGPRTPVLTQRGWAPLALVRLDDRLWDGEEWVRHAGVVRRGRKATMDVDGVAMTSDHPVFLGGGSWVSAQILNSRGGLIEAALNSGSSRLPPEAAAHYDGPLRGENACTETYDIAHAGPRNRFTIKSASGHLIVHNCGYGGWINSARVFGMPGTDDEVKASILAWRAASPEIPDLWGGQPSWRRNEYWGVEGAAILALMRPGQVQYPALRSPTAHAARMAHYYDPQQDILFVQLISGRWLRYHRPRLAPSTRREGEQSMSYEGWNTNPKKGPPGWIRMDTYGPRLVENYTQATCRDILANAIVNLERQGYPVVLHIYDEVVSDVPEGFGSVEEFERIMATMPAWCADWPVKATNGWRGKRYKK